MDALQELRDKVAQETAASQAAQELAWKNKVAQARDMVTGQLGKEVLNTLNAEFLKSGALSSRVVVKFHYRGHTTEFPIDSGSLRPKVAGWLAQVDQEIAVKEEEREVKRKKLLDRFSPENQAVMEIARPRLEAAQHTIRAHGLEGDQELTELMVAYMRKIEAAEAVWRQEAEAERQREQHEHAARKAEVLEILTNATTGDDLWTIRGDISDQWGGWEGDFAYDDDVRNAYTAAVTRIAQLDEEREQKRYAAQVAAFHPFLYYRVWYAAMASDEGETYVDQSYFDTLYPIPDDGGWWRPISGRKNPMRVANVVKVECITVTDHTNMPDWCPLVSTEYGGISVPPPDATEIG